MFKNERFIEIQKTIEKSKSKKYADLISIYKKTHSIENVNNRLTFLFSSYAFSAESIGVEEASKYFFNKNIAELNQSEKINLVLMLDNSALYNPLRNKKSLPKKIEEYKQMINK